MEEKRREEKREEDVKVGGWFPEKRVEKEEPRMRKE